MNDKLENQLSKVVEKSLQLAEKTGGFVVDQAPELLREFYTWHMIDNIIGIVFNAIILYVVYRVIRYFGVKEEWDFEDGSVVTSSVLGAIVGLISFFWMFYCITVLIKIIVAPKIYLIEYFIR